jgi:hypothetical protein
MWSSEKSALLSNLADSATFSVDSYIVKEGILLFAAVRIPQ